MGQKVGYVAIFFHVAKNHEFSPNQTEVFHRHGDMMGQYDWDMSATWYDILIFKNWMLQRKRFVQ